MSAAIADIEAQCIELNILVPTKPTLTTYGYGHGLYAMDEDPRGDWLRLLHRQGYACGTCGKLPNVSERYKGRRFVTDHEHVRGWKKMPPAQRRGYVRGLLCYWCNKTYVGRAITVEIARGVLRYLLVYESRRPR